MNTIKILSVFSFIAFFTFSPSVSAQTVRPTVNTDQRCSIATSKVDLLITRYNNNKDRHINRYNTAKDKIQKSVETLEKNGYDVTTLKADLKTWDAMIVKIGTETAQVITELNKSKEYVCGKSQGSYVDSLQKAKRELADVRQASLDVRNYYQNTIRKDLNDLKAQKTN